MTRDIFLDNAAVRREEDAFNRWPFSKRLADTIAGFDASDGAPVLGVFGKWGYGKTTVLNFVQGVLETDHGDRVAIFQFNPWLFKDPEALLGAFFAGLAETVDASLGSVGKEAGAILAKYGGALSAVPLVGAGLGKLAESVGKEMAADPVQAQRDRLITIMRNAPRTVVVLIDDLDRLDRDEIMTMLKVVRLSANFPHVIYLLAFDEERVARAAGQAYGEAADGRQFLEKIIQYPFSLPAVGHERLLAFVVRQARAACDAAGITLGSPAWDRYRHVCGDMLMVRLTTPRQAIR
jgi:predicted KAP-like P-loop ATPase